MRLPALKGELADWLFEVGAIKFGEFRLKLHEKQPNAPLSPIFFNLRTKDNPKPGPLDAAVLHQIGRLMYEQTWLLQFDLLAPVPNAGNPFATALAEATMVASGRPVGVLKLEKLEEDGQRRIGSHIRGEFSPGQIALLVDDLITQADTKLEAITALGAAGLQVKALTVLIDREQGGSTVLRNRGYEVWPVYRLHS